MGWIKNSWANFSPYSLWKRWRHPEIHVPTNEAQEMAVSTAATTGASVVAADTAAATALIADMLAATSVNIARHAVLGPQIMERAALLYLEFRATMLNPVFRGLVNLNGSAAVDVDKMALFDDARQHWVRFKFNNLWRLQRRERMAANYGSRDSVKLHYTKIGHTGGAVLLEPCLTDDLMCSTMSVGEGLKLKANFKPITVRAAGAEAPSVKAFQYPFKNWIDGTVGKVFFGDMYTAGATSSIKNDTQLGVLLMRFLNWYTMRDYKIPRGTNPADPSLLAVLTRPLKGPLIASVQPNHMMNFEDLDILAINWLLTTGLSKKAAEVHWPLLCLLYNNENERQVKAASLIPLRNAMTPGQTQSKGLATSIIDRIRVQQEKELSKWAWYSTAFLAQKRSGDVKQGGLGCGFTDAADPSIHRACSILKPGAGPKRELRDELQLNKLWGAGRNPTARSPVGAYDHPELAALANANPVVNVGSSKYIPNAATAAADASAQGIWFMVSLPKMPHTLLVIIRMGIVFTIGGGYDPKEMIKCTYTPGLVKAPLQIFSPDTAIYGMLETVGPNQFKGTVRSDGFFDQYITNAGFYDAAMENRLRQMIDTAEGGGTFPWPNTRNGVKTGTFQDITAEIKSKDDVDTFRMPPSWEGGAYSSWSGLLVGGMNCMSVASWIAGITRGYFLERPTGPGPVAAKAGPQVEKMTPVAVAAVKALIEKYIIPTVTTGAGAAAAAAVLAQAHAHLAQGGQVSQQVVDDEKERRKAEAETMAKAEATAVMQKTLGYLNAAICHEGQCTPLHPKCADGLCADPLAMQIAQIFVTHPTATLDAHHGWTATTSQSHFQPWWHFLVGVALPAGQQLTAAQVPEMVNWFYGLVRPGDSFYPTQVTEFSRDVIAAIPTVAAAAAASPPQPIPRYISLLTQFNNMALGLSRNAQGGQGFGGGRRRKKSRRRRKRRVGKSTRGRKRRKRRRRRKRTKRRRYRKHRKTRR